MDFRDILDKWDSRKHEAKTDDQAESAASAMDLWLDSYPPGQDFENEDDRPLNNAVRARERRVLRSMMPEETIDLHGHSVASALHELKLFLQSAQDRGLRKLSVVHGKGNHSSGGAVLKQAVTRYVQGSPIVGEISTPQAKHGGSGATWVVLRQRSL